MEKPLWLVNMETMLEVLNEGVIIPTDRHQILFANTRFIEMTGIPRDLTLRYSFPQKKENF
jgi:PAS domain-containing protein